jgi:chitin synthase
MCVGFIVLEFAYASADRLASQPNDFLDERYSLRQILYETPRRTELFIVMTMYNVSGRVALRRPRRRALICLLWDTQEDEVLFCRTMHGVMSAFALIRSPIPCPRSLTTSLRRATENIQHLCERTRSKTWGADGWKKGTSL